MRDADQIRIALRSMGMLNPPPSKYLDRFCARIRITERGCWEWVAARAYYGYGHFCFRGRHFSTHRLIHMWMYGPILPGIYVLHHCDNPPCVNPDHLYRGTQKDNVRDMFLRGRKRHLLRKGERRPSLLPPDLLNWAVFARKNGMSFREIARWCEKPVPVIKHEIRREIGRRTYRPHQIFKAEIGRIRELRTQGRSHLAIAKELGVGETAIWKWIHKLGLQ
jgi:hypothetical protein